MIIPTIYRLNVLVNATSIVVIVKTEFEHEMNKV
jgi:hypothetical protein